MPINGDSGSLCVATVLYALFLVCRMKGVKPSDVFTLEPVNSVSFVIHSQMWPSSTKYASSDALCSTCPGVEWLGVGERE